MGETTGWGSTGVLKYHSRPEDWDASVDVNGPSVAAMKANGYFEKIFWIASRTAAFGVASSFSLPTCIKCQWVNDDNGQVYGEHV